MKKHPRAYIRIFLCFILLLYYYCSFQVYIFIYGYDIHKSLEIRRRFTKSAMRILGIDLEVSGTPYRGTCLFVSNHRNMIDPVIQLSCLDAVIVSKAEVRKYPFIGKGAAQTGVIFVQRDEKPSRSEAREAIRTSLLQGRQVLIYPEGTTSDLPGTLEFKPGSFQEAMALSMPIVPVVMEYGSRIDYWSESPLMSHFLRMFSKPVTKAYLKFGTPITAESPEEAVTVARAWIEEHILRIQSRRER